MHIVQIYHAPVPVNLYGGMERVIEGLCEGFVELGHKVTLISFPGDYKIPGVDCVSLQGHSKDPNTHDWKALLPEDFDVLHFHVPFNIDELNLPYVMTMHGNLQADEDPLSLPNNTIFLTKNHAERHGRNSFVFNGINPQGLPDLTDKKSPYFAFLGRASLKRKGLHLAKQIAKVHSTSLYVGGGRGLSWNGVKYLGHLNNQQKFELLSKAKVFLFPIQWEEPFGLVLIEAMLCGAPIWALSRGSVPEILGRPDAPQAFLHAPDIAQLVDFSKSFSFDISSQAIRDYALRHFTHIKMCEGYLEQYKSL